MSKITGKETKPEILVRKYLFSKGFRYKKNDKNLPGKPDIVLPKYNTIVLIHGCFWHGHKNCVKAKLPETRIDFWREKIGKNIDRDFSNYMKLKCLGWKVLIIWQCEIKNDTLRECKLRSLLMDITSINE